MDEFLNPNEILNKIDLRKNMIALDFGSGAGGWAIPLAKKLEKGKVYAIDVQEEPLSALESKIKTQKIANIEGMLADVEAELSRFPAGACDLVLMTNLLFEVEDKKRALQEGARVLKFGGKILVVDWKIDAPVGPKEGRVSSNDVKALAQEIGLRVDKEFTAGVYHYGLILVK